MGATSKPRQQDQAYGCEVGDRGRGKFILRSPQKAAGGAPEARNSHGLRQKDTKNRVSNSPARGNKGAGISAISMSN